jgi:3-hydroxybutyryl-CoA dehydratase
MNAKNLSFSEIKVGDTASFSRVWTEKDVIAFAELSGEYAKTKSLGQRLVHGMLLGSLCSALVGMYLPGKRCLYLSQKLVFKNPVFISDTVDVRGTVTLKSQSTKVLSVFIVMKKGEEVVVEGEAWVRMI